MLFGSRHIRGGWVTLSSKVVLILPLCQASSFSQRRCYFSLLCTTLFSILWSCRCYLQFLGCHVLFWGARLAKIIVTFFTCTYNAGTLEHNASICPLHMEQIAFLLLEETLVYLSWYACNNEPLGEYAHAYMCLFLYFSKSAPCIFHLPPVSSSCSPSL